jgi:hypothetical protein
MKNQKIVLFTFVALSVFSLSIATFGGEKSEADIQKKKSATQGKQTENVSFNEEEKFLLRNWGGDFFGKYQEDIFFFLTVRDVLVTGCGWSRNYQPDSYNSQEHPDCAKILSFLKYYQQEHARLDREYRQARNRLRKEIDKVVKEVYDRHIRKSNGR